MNKRLVQTLVLAGVMVISLNVATSAVNSMVIEAKTREQTIVDAIIKSQVAQKMETVEQEIAQVLEEENIVIIQEEVEIKPPEPIIEETIFENILVEEPIIEEPIIEEIIEEIAEEISEEIEEYLEPEEDFVIDVVIDDEQINALVQHGLTLTSTDQLIEKAYYLVDYYFLDGYIFYTEEQDPILKEEKRLVHNMEIAVIRSLNVLLEPLENLSTILKYDFSIVTNEVTILSENFSENFISEVAGNDEMEVIFEGIENYFANYLHMAQVVETLVNDINEASNPALVMTLVLAKLNSDIIPGVKEILNTSFVLKDEINKIYLKGVTDFELMTPKEVVEYILS
ncbi:MAG: hypothetical protein ATN36_05455 [Epulopiscium sp. Nele67-Bin005]|nr:MAG: hypothetical protein ATN36_05455 [Epulopiscium sp. Nele67-Bin005]